MPGAIEGREWTLAGGRGQTLLLEEGRASGSGGCNPFTGGYELAGDRIAFAPLASTRMACEPERMRAESDFFAALARAALASLEGEVLVLADDAGAELLRFTAETNE